MYPELKKIMPNLLAHYEKLVPAQHMGTVGPEVPVPSEIVKEIKHWMEVH